MSAFQKLLGADELMETKEAASITVHSVKLLAILDPNILDTEKMDDSTAQVIFGKQGGRKAQSNGEQLQGAWFPEDEGH